MGNLDDWNVLTDAWLGVVDREGHSTLISPFDALRQSHSLRSIWADNPMDVFAGYRFLLTLLYWQAECVGGVEALRERLLGGKMPADVLNALNGQRDRFRLYDETQPFLQDPTLDRKQEDSVGYLFAECASGTNVAHFHHGDDKAMRLCFRCVTAGLMRVVPWTQSGGSGKTPAIHNAPPIMLLCHGAG
jgi:CRISPR system Cascade subunit CasA